jgi:cell division septation protein DedD
MPSEQTELVLENRQVVAIFLGLALLCGIFFALGYVVGTYTAGSDATAQPADEQSVQSVEKPSALPSPTYMPRGVSTANAAPAPETDLNFYNSVQQDEPQGIEPAADAAEAAPPTAPVALPPPGILVQVSALTRREDAESLVALLKEKELPVLVTAGENDPLFHVVIGPYKTEGEAQRVKTLLEQDGFRPFIRRSQ